MPELKDCRIVFMGTPDFAVAILDKLVTEGCSIVTVVTAPDKPAGRGMQLSQSAVKKYAVEKGLPVLQPEKLKDPSFVSALQALRADVQVVVAFRMLPEVVWNMPPLGTINLHASLLPKYRGAAPINWAIIHGEKKTGITTFKLQHAIDTGDILMQQELPIRVDETAGELHDEMKVMGADLVYKTLHEYCPGRLSPSPQLATGEDADSFPSAPKIHTDTCKINWEQPACGIHNLIRGLSPYPAAFSYLEGKQIKIFRAEVLEETPGAAPGTWSTDGKTFLKFAAADGWISITELQLEGKKRMDVQSFLRGFRFQ